MQERRGLMAAIVCLACAAGFPLGVSAAPDARKDFRIPRGPAGESVAAFARQADVNVLASNRNLDGVTTNEVTGSHTMAEALALLVAGTGLRVRINGGSVFIMGPAVAAAAPPPAIPAVAAPDHPPAQEVVVTGSRLVSRGYQAPSPTTVVDGEEFRLGGAQVIETLLMQSPQFIGNMYNATGNGGSIGISALNMRGLGEQRSLTLVNGRRYTVTGVDALTDLNTIPAALIKRAEIVTGGSSAVYGSDAVAGVVNFILRTDFKGIEATAQTRRDVRTDTPINSAALTVGGDINGGRGNAVVSLDYYNRGGILRSQYPWAAQGLADGCVTAASYSDRRPGVPLPVAGGQTCAGAGGKPGFVAANSAATPAGRFYNVPTYGSARSTPGLDAALLAAGLRDLTSFGFTFDRGSNRARPAIDPDDRYNNTAVNYMQTPLRRVMASGYANERLGRHATAYMEAHVSDYIARTAIAPGIVSGSVLVDTANPYLSAADQAVLRQLDLMETGTTTLRQGASTYATTPGDGRAVLGIYRRNMDAGSLLSSFERTTVRALLGVRGDAGGFAYDMYYTFTRTRSTETQSGNFSLSRWQEAILAANGSPPLLNPFGPNALTPAAVQAVQVTTTNGIVNDQRVAAANLTRTLANLAAGPMDVGTGLEWRSSRLAVAPDALNLASDMAGQLAIAPVAGGTSVKEWYAEGRLPVLKDAPLARHLILNGAIRYSHYDLKGVGGVWTHSAGLEWQPLRDLAVRAQAQKAIRAPDTNELYGARATLTPVLTDPCSGRQPAAMQTAALRTLCAATGVPPSAVFSPDVQPNPQVWTLGGGNPALKAERANTATLGVVVTPRAIPRLMFSADFYQIGLDRAIAPFGGNPQNVFDLCYTIIADAGSQYCKALHRDTITGALSGFGYAIDQSRANTGGIRSAGIDLNAHYALDLPAGAGVGASRIEAGANWNWLRDYTFTPVQELPDLKNHCAGAYGSICGAPAPVWKGNARVTWRSAWMTLSLHARFVGAVLRDTYLVPLRQGKTPSALDSLTAGRVPAQRYVDLSFALRLPAGFELSGGIDNLFARDPPLLGSGAVTWGLGTAPGTYEVFGRNVFLGLSRRM